MSPPNPENSAPPSPVPSKKLPDKAKAKPQYYRYALLAILGLMVVVFLAISFAGIGKLSKKSQELVDVKLKTKTLDSQLTALEAAKKQIAKYGYFNDVAKTVIPNDKDQAQAVLDITQQANKSGISIASINFPTSTLGGRTTSASATSSTSSLNAISQAIPVTGIKGLYSLQLTVVPLTGPNVTLDKRVTYPKFLNFLKRIEHDRRTAQITQISIQPMSDKSGPTGEISFSLIINIFIRPTK